MGWHDIHRRAIHWYVNPLLDCLFEDRVLVSKTCFVSASNPVSFA